MNTSALSGGAYNKESYVEERSRGAHCVYCHDPRMTVHCLEEKKKSCIHPGATPGGEEENYTFRPTHQVVVQEV